MLDLQNWGFNDYAKNIQACIETNGDMQQLVDRLSK